jgi:hypothetical protein
MKNSIGRLLLIGFILILLIPLQGDEGMWLFNMPPTNILKTVHNFNMTPGWLTHIQLSSILFGGASGSFVSTDGLVLTNHHVGRGIIQNLSTKEKDLMKTGFYARTRAEELSCPGLELSVLQGIEDVTPQVLAIERPGMTSAETAEARAKSMAALEKERSEKTGYKCTVVSLYSGGMYHLYMYKIYTDVRLVFAPEYSIAKFGGDPDNFCYPRYALDICFFRIYENNKPLNSPQYLRWGKKDIKEGDLVFASGHPGSTGRLLTYSQLEFLRDVAYPFSIRNLQRRKDLLHAYSDLGAEETRIALTTLLGIENSLKAVTGYQSGLLDNKIMSNKAKAEAELREAVMKDPDLAKTYGKVWEDIAGAQKKHAALHKSLQFFERNQGFNTVYFNYARNLVRMAQEVGKPNGERLKEYRDSNLPSVKRNVLSQTPIYDEFEIVKLADSLAQLKEEAGDCMEVNWIIGNRSTEEVARELISGTTLKDMEVRKKYMDNGLEAVYRSSDPMIKLALMIDPLSRALRSQFEKEVEAVETENGALIARALFKLKGTSIPPDATSTLRLSFGVVKSYVENGKKIPFQTTFAGLFERSKKFGGKPPFSLPQSFIAKKSRLDLNAPLDFVATCDSIGGNSGSPIINRKGEFVGILFDGNMQSLPARFVYDDELNRSVMVHFQGILEALLKVYGANPLVAEILGKAGSS